MTTPFRTLSRPVEILLVEDNSMDARLIKEALNHSHFALNIAVAGDVEKALDRLRPPAHKPELVLLDLGLPKKDGWVVLEQMKKDPALDHIPVVILTGSKDEAAAQRARELKADLFIVKPMDLMHFPILVNSIEHLLADQPHWQTSRS